MLPKARPQASQDTPCRPLQKAEKTPIKSQEGHDITVPGGTCPWEALGCLKTTGAAHMSRRVHSALTLQTSSSSHSGAAAEVTDARMASPGQPVPQGAGGRLEAREGLGGGHTDFPG